MAKEDDETIEMDMPPEEARRLLESLDERSEDLDTHSENFPEPLKYGRKHIWQAEKSIYRPSYSRRLVWWFCCQY